MRANFKPTQGVPEVYAMNYWWIWKEAWMCLSLWSWVVFSQETVGNHCGLGNQLLDFPALPGRCEMVRSFSLTQILTITEGSCCDKDEHFHFPLVLLLGLFALINSIQQGIILLIAEANSCLLKASVMHLFPVLVLTFSWLLKEKRIITGHCHHPLGMLMYIINVGGN